MQIMLWQSLGSCALLGALIALIQFYPTVLHAPDSRDVRAATFVAKDKTCYKMRAVVTPC